MSDHPTRDRSLPAAQRKLRDVAARVGYARLGEEHLAEAIRDAAEDGRIPPDLASVVRARLAARTLAPRNLHAILTARAGARPPWDELRALALGSLAGAPAGAVTLLHMGSQQGLWSAPEYETRRAGPPHRPVFATVARLRRGDEALASESCEASSLKRSEQLASVQLIARLAGLPCPPLGLEPEPAADAEAAPAPAGRTAPRSKPGPFRNPKS